MEEHESAGEEERPDELRHEDPLAVRALLPHPPDVRVDGGHLGRHVGILAAQPLQRPLRLLLLMRVEQEARRFRHAPEYREICDKTSTLQGGASGRITWLG